MAKVALVSGITGQDGAYLTALLLSKGYTVHGIVRRSSLLNTQRIDPFLQAQQVPNPKLQLHYGDLSDSTAITRLVGEIKPDEIYNLGAQSHVGVSFETPEYTADVTGIGALRFLEAIRILKLQDNTKFYQASTSEMYGKVMETPQNERTPFCPQSPYGAAKCYAYMITENYRTAFGVRSFNGILFNHESPLRGEAFVSRKVTSAVARISYGIQECLYVGNLAAKRDWGHARDYVEGMWRMMQLDKGDTYVLATGKTHSVRDLIRTCFRQVGINLQFDGKGDQEVGINGKTGEVLVRVDPSYLRPTEVDELRGDYGKAERLLGWSPTVSFEKLCAEMVAADLYRTEAALGKLRPAAPTVEELVHRAGGFRIPQQVKKKQSA